MRIFILSTLFCLVGATAMAQNDKGDEGRSNAFEPYTPSEQRQPEKKAKKQKRKKQKSFRQIYNKRLKTKREEFYELMEANAKRRKKMAKEMEKPQYSDPMYFGHKKKPKKRPVGKRKLCKECGIVH